MCIRCNIWLNSRDWPNKIAFMCEMRYKLSTVGLYNLTFKCKSVENCFHFLINLYDLESMLLSIVSINTQSDRFVRAATQIEY